MAEIEKNNEFIEETAAPIEKTVAEETEEVSAKEENKEVKKSPVIAKIRSALTNFLWVFPIVYFALIVLLLYSFGQNLLAIFDYPLNATTIENVALSIEELFVSPDEVMLVPLITFFAFTIIFAVFSIICFVRAIIAFVGIFTLLGKKSEEEKILKFGKLSRSFLISYALYFELLLFARIGEYNVLGGGVAVIIITCVSYFLISAVWQLITAKDKEAFDWKAEAFKFIRTLLLPTLALLFAIYGIPAWVSSFLTTLSESISSGKGMAPDQIMQVVSTFLCGLIESIIMITLVRKVFAFGAIKIKKSEKKPAKDAGNILFVNGIVYLVFAIIKAVAMSIGGVLAGGGFDGAIFAVEIKAIIIPLIIFLSIISISKFTPKDDGYFVEE